MLTGQRAFEGKSQLSVASAILEKEPAPISSIKPLTPLALDYAVKKCLAKVPEERWQSASDLASQLKWIGESGSEAGALAMRRAKTSERIAWLVIAACALLAAIFGFLRAGRAPEKGRVVRSYIKAMPGSSFVFGVSPMSGFALSPDGLHLAYVAQDAN